MTGTTNGYDRGEDMQIVNFLARLTGPSHNILVVSTILGLGGKLTGMGTNAVGGLLVFQAEIPARFAAGGWVQAIAASAGCDIRELD